MGRHDGRSMAKELKKDEDSGVVFHLELGNLRGRLAPERRTVGKTGGLTRWYGQLWHEDKPKKILTEVTDDTHWEAGDALVAEAKELLKEQD